MDKIIEEQMAAIDILNEFVAKSDFSDYRLQPMEDLYSLISGKNWKDFATALSSAKTISYNWYSSDKRYSEVISNEFNANQPYFIMRPARDHENDGVKIIACTLYSTGGNGALSPLLYLCSIIRCNFDFSKKNGFPLTSIVDSLRDKKVSDRVISFILGKILCFQNI